MTSAWVGSRAARYDNLQPTGLTLQPLSRPNHAAGHLGSNEYGARENLLGPVQDNALDDEDDAAHVE